MKDLSHLNELDESLKDWERLITSTLHGAVPRAQAGEPRRGRAGASRIGGPEHEMRRLLRLAQFPEPVAVGAERTFGGGDLRWKILDMKEA